MKLWSICSQREGETMIYHPCKSWHPGTCLGCTADETKHGKEVQLKASLKTLKYLLCEFSEGKMVKVTEAKRWATIKRRKDARGQGFILSECVVVDKQASDHGQVMWFDEENHMYEYQPFK